jgi:hypothetical protein
MNRILACTVCVDDWQRFLANRNLHWQKGHSAQALATSWQQSDGFPPDVARAVTTAADLAGATPLLAVPEYKVPLPGGGRGSQSDLLVLGRTARGAFAMAVEGKVSESFGPLVDEWLAVGTPGRLRRWRSLCQLLQVDSAICGRLRYQLFHRTASALLAAQMHHATIAAFLVHSFSAKRAGFDDYAAFLRSFGVGAADGAFVRVPLQTERFKDLTLLVGWVTGEPAF